VDFKEVIGQQETIARLVKMTDDEIKARQFAKASAKSNAQKEKLKIPMERVRRFFPASYTTVQMEEEIVKMCEARYRSRVSRER